jgi:hypothetical protein
MKPIDRFQALIRHPDYRRDARLYIPTLKIGLLNFVSEIAAQQVSEERWRQLVKGYTFLRIWGLGRAVDPENPEQIAALLRALCAGDVSIFKADLRGYIAAEHEDKIDPGTGCYINICMDLERPTSELQTLFSMMIKRERKERRITPKRTKPHGVDPWTVWDMKQVRGNNFLKITRTLCHVQGNPAYDPKVKQSYEQVKRAHQKAVAMIKEVGTSCNKALTEEIVEASLAQAIRALFERVSKISKGGKE